ncbi:MAG: hypothetical protein MI922_03490 [Bacteroidales bacterium]|nr:hypothetical protein [Bacteroidales bacterium]
MNKKIIPFVLLAASFWACEEEQNNQLCTPTNEFNIDLYINNLLDVLDDESKIISGYQLAVNQNGNLYFSKSSGFARYSVDDLGQQNMTTMKPLYPNKFATPFLMVNLV